MKRQTPAKRTRGSSSQPITVDEDIFYNSSARKLFEKTLKSKPFLSERIFNFSSFQDPIIEDVIVNHGWENLANLAGPIIPDLVKEFYANMHKEAVNYTVRDVSVVRGHRVILSPSLIASVLDIPVIVRPDFSTAEEDFLPVDVVHSFLRSDGKFSEEFSDKLPQRFLGVAARMLNLFICANIWPTEHHGELSLPRCQLIYSMLNHKSICVCSLIFHQILHVQMVISTPIKLVFPVLICRILERSGVSVSGESLSMRPPITHKTGSRSMKQSPLASDSDEDLPEQTTAPSTSTSAAADFTPVLTELASLSSDVKSIAKSVQSLSQTVHSMDTGLSRFITDFQPFMAEFRSILPSIQDLANMTNDLDSLPSVSASIRRLTASATSLVTSVDELGSSLSVHGQRREAAEMEVQQILKAIRDAQIEQEGVFAKLARHFRSQR